MHWPGTTQDRIDAADPADIAARLRGYRNHHVNVKGWSDVGYGVAGDQAGRVWDCRGITRVPAASASAGNPDANWEWGAFLFVIGDSETPSPALVQAFQDWRRDRWLRKWPKATLVRGHQQVPGASTACPGARTMNLIRSGDLLRPLEDDVNLTDKLNLITGGEVDYSSEQTTVAGVLASTNYYTLVTRNRVVLLDAKVAALEAVLAQHVGSDPSNPLTVEQVTTAAREGAAEALAAGIDLRVTVDDQES